MFTLKVSAYCMMPNHYHLLVQTPNANLSRCMRHINGVYTQRYNAHNKSDGTLFRGRYKAILVDADSYLLELTRYIHRNPVRAGIVKELDHYAWSSHRGYLSQEPEWKWLHKGFVLGMLGKSRAVQLEKYRHFVEKQDAKTLVSLFEKKNLPSMLGGKQFVKGIKKKFSKEKIDKNVPQSKTLVPDRHTIINGVCKAYESDGKEIAHVRRGVSNEPRNVAIYLLRKISGETLMGIGREFGMNQYSSVSSAVNRIHKKRKKDRQFLERLNSVIESIKKGQT